MNKRILIWEQKSTPEKAMLVLEKKRIIRRGRLQGRFVI
ncbi:hypothetical protein SLEP1_g23142 [Rubroshorea leprosula]|uniref:Uncharacterized protein n=1 Tax=Rubroshorea leprosula TaxID=152421 RepID=A0AAV5JKS1_9ROSI|nr:hypothetical protein SLEP1_g23142 [Rubroshorea leprosula]